MTARATRWDLSTTTAWENFQAFVGQLQLAGKRPLFQWVPEKRSNEQNSMIQALYRELGKQIEGETPKSIMMQCKLDIGVPILCGLGESDPDIDFKEHWENGPGTLPYDKRLDAMRYYPVTSLMTKPQGAEFIDTLIRVYSQQGYSIVHPGEEQYAAN